MRAPEPDSQLTQIHLNLRRFFHFFTGTITIGSLCLVTFQIISQHIQRSSQYTHLKITAYSEHLKQLIISNSA